MRNKGGEMMLNKIRQLKSLKPYLRRYGMLLSENKKAPPT